MAAPNLMSPALIGELLGLMPGAEVVSYGGVETNGHFEHVPELTGDEPGVLASGPSVVIPAGVLPGIGLFDGEGAAKGIGKVIVVGDYEWTIRGVEPATAPGEIRLLLANR